MRSCNRPLLNPQLLMYMYIATRLRSSSAGGSTCWNGPARSLALLFECGSSDAMLSVDEPEKCTYTARFTSPAACDAKAARQLYMELEVDVGGAQREEL